MVWLQLSLILIALLGVGYIMVSRDISKNHGLVLVGGLTKLSFFLMSLVYFFIGDLNVLIVLLGSVDLIMVILFTEFLLKNR
jgi:CHASE2 domain-containing sensor protein